MKRIPTLFVVLALVSLALLYRERREQRFGDLAESLAKPSSTPLSDSISTSSASTRRAGMSGLSAGENEKLRILDQVLVARDDNDPRLDRELRQLSDPLKSVLMTRYHQIPAELRGARGTLVLLIGRNLTRPEDFAFLGQVLKEPLCWSLSDCKSPSGAGTGSDEIGANDIALAYPQWVALRSLEGFYASGGNSRDALNALRSAAAAPDHAIAHRASSLLKKISGHG